LSCSPKYVGTFRLASVVLASASTARVLTGHAP
jgi:hypothetical protein